MKTGVDQAPVFFMSSMFRFAISRKDILPLGLLHDCLEDGNAPAGGDGPRVGEARFKEEGFVFLPGPFPSPLLKETVPRLRVRSCRVGPAAPGMHHPPLNAATR